MIVPDWLRDDYMTPARPRRYNPHLNDIIPSHTEKFMLSRRSILLSVCLLVLSGAMSVDAAKPNIVLIMADDMGYGDVRALNTDSTIPTPHLDKLAAQGMTFTDAHSPSGVCTPTRYGLLTGRYCWRTSLRRGVLGGYSAPLIQKERATIASMLRGQGYATAAVGKWHLGMNMPKKGAGVKTRDWQGDGNVDFAGKINDSPITRGFDYYFGVSASLDMAPYVWIENDRFTMQPTMQQKALKFPDFVRAGPRSKDFVIDEVLDKLADKTVERIKQGAAGDKPFFIYMPLTAPHKPATPHKRFRGKSKLGPYGDFIMQVDDTIGRVMKGLDDAGVADSTVVIFTSDNGSFMYRYDESDKKDHVDDATIQGYRAEHHRANGPFRGTKADVWEGGHHVPFFVRWPAKVKAGSKCDEPITHTDVFATCAAIAGAKLGNDVAEDSVSFLPALSGKPHDRGVGIINHSASGMFAIRDGKWKLVAGNGSGGRQQPRGKPFARPYHLFDLGKDIGETTNLIEKHPDIAKKMEAALEKIRNDGRSVKR